MIVKVSVCNLIRFEFFLPADITRYFLSTSKDKKGRKLPEKEVDILVNQACQRLFKLTRDAKTHLIREYVAQDTSTLRPHGRYMFEGIPPGPLNFVIFADDKKNRDSWFYKLISSARFDRVTAALDHGMVVSGLIYSFICSVHEC